MLSYLQQRNIHIEQAGAPIFSCSTHPPSAAINQQVATFWQEYQKACSCSSRVPLLHCLPSVDLLGAVMTSAAALQVKAVGVSFGGNYSVSEEEDEWGVDSLVWARVLHSEAFQSTPWVQFVAALQGIIDDVDVEWLLQDIMKQRYGSFEGGGNILVLVDDIDKAPDPGAVRKHLCVRQDWWSEGQVIALIATADKALIKWEAESRPVILIE